MERCVCVISSVKFSTPIRILRENRWNYLSFFFFRSSSGKFSSGRSKWNYCTISFEQREMGLNFFYSSLRKVCVCEGKKSYFLWTDIGCATYFAFIEVSFTELSELVFFFMRAMERVEGYRHWSRIFYLINSSINLTDLTTIIGIESIGHFFSVAR